jgi:hypothetical protein
MSGIQQNFAYGRSFGPPYGWPVANIGDAYGGGFFAGQINVSGTKYNLVVSPKASGESSSIRWDASGTTRTTGITSVINGPANSAALAALGVDYQAATFCESLTIGGYSDWYLPAFNELEVLYYYLKPSTTANTSFSNPGSNANAVAPEPINTLYTSGNPAQTSATAFKSGGSEAIIEYINWTSTEYSAANAFVQTFDNGAQYTSSKFNNNCVRAIRRVLA